MPSIDVSINNNPHPMDGPRGTSRRRVQAEEDDFWRIALTADVSELRSTDALDSSSVEEEDHQSSCVAHHDDVVVDGQGDYDPIVTTAAHSYRLPLHGDVFSNGVTLRLSGLSTGIGSPLGAQAWYGSALLSAVLLDPRSDDLREALANTECALELGSGAVGLSGLALACAVAQHSHHQGGSARPSVPPRIVLTDNDHLVLAQLQDNVVRATSQLSQEYPDLLLPDVTVSRLDWDDAASLSVDVTNSLYGIRLIVGSELVYTSQNAKACAETILALLRLNPTALVVIVQVTDREGWASVFVPALEESKDFSVRVEPIDPAWHDKASSMIPLGGTTDRFDFGVCYISRVS